MEKENKTRLLAIIFVVLLLVPVSTLVVHGEKPLFSSSRTTSYSTKQSTSDVQLVSDEATQDASGSENSPQSDDSSSFPFEKLLNDASDHSLSNTRFKNRLIDLLERLKLLFVSIHRSEDRETDDSDPPDNTTDNTTDDIPTFANNTNEVNGSENYPRVDPPEPGNSSYQYPRLSLGTCKLQNWVSNPEYGLEWLYQFQNIYTSTPADRVITIKQQAIADDHRDWVENTTFIDLLCTFDVSYYETRPANWVYQMASYMPEHTVNIAVYENSLLGCDWFFRDINGSRIHIWGNATHNSWAADTSPDCDLGLWDGNYTINGVHYYIGDTRGKTYNEWLVSMKEPVMLHSIWKNAFDGIQSEDGPSAWYYTFNNQIPDPKHDHIGMTYNQLEDYCHDSWEYVITGFYGELAQQGYITRMNGNGLRWYYEGWPNPYEYNFDSYTSCKMEDYGQWGGFPWHNDSLNIWAYINIEKMFHPLSTYYNDPLYDEKQGWDVTTLQVNANYNWSDHEIDKWKRMGLANCLLGDGYFDGYAYRDDYFFHFFMNNGQTQYAPRGIPQMSFKLGTACGDYSIYYDPLYPMKPLYYRQFYNDDTEKYYTVVSNPHWQTINNIPWHDGVWFEGDWPYGTYTPVIFE